MAAPAGGGRYNILAPAVQARLFALFDQRSVSLRGGVGRGLGLGAGACRRQGGSGLTTGGGCPRPVCFLSTVWVSARITQHGTVSCSQTQQA
jgi:hypothetical protein